MDATTATVIAAAVGVAGAILGALINQLGAGRVAERLSHLSGRIDAYGAVWNAIITRDQAAIDAAWQRVGGPTSAMRHSAWDAVPDPGFHEAAVQAVAVYFGEGERPFRLNPNTDFG